MNPQAFTAAMQVAEQTKLSPKAADDRDVGALSNSIDGLLLAIQKESVSQFHFNESIHLIPYQNLSHSVTTSVDDVYHDARPVPASMSLGSSRLNVLSESRLFQSWSSLLSLKCFFPFIFCQMLGKFHHCYLSFP
jgi:hypothetical protein